MLLHCIWTKKEPCSLWCSFDSSLCTFMACHKVPSLESKPQFYIPFHLRQVSQLLIYRMGTIHTSYAWFRIPRGIKWYYSFILQQIFIE
jgi:hypothetical protein